MTRSELTNGHTNGYTNGTASNGHANGYTNGHTNGHTNGYTNGHSNGYTNGHTNGSLNGHSSVSEAPQPNGHANGYTNGHADNAPRHSKDAATMPIAIIGIGCRFPGDTTSPEKLWKLCTQAKSAWSEIPKDRYNQKAFYHPDGESKGTVSLAAHSQSCSAEVSQGKRWRRPLLKRRYLSIRCTILQRHPRRSESNGSAATAPA